MSNTETCPHCNLQNTLRWPNVIDKSIVVAKLMGNPWDLAKGVAGFAQSGPGTFGIGKYKYEDRRSYRVCNHCDGFCFYCSQCDTNVSLSSRPGAFDRFPCPICSKVYWYDGK